MSTKLIQISFANKNGKYEFRHYFSNPPYDPVPKFQLTTILDSTPSKLIYERLNWYLDRLSEKDKWYVDNIEPYQNIVQQKFPIWIHRSLYQIKEYDLSDVVDTILSSDLDDQSKELITNQE